MTRRFELGRLLGTGLFVMGMAGVAMAQPRADDVRGGNPATRPAGAANEGPGGFGGGFRGRGGGYLDDAKQGIGATDPEWKVIGPKLRKVVALRQSLDADRADQGGGGGFGFGGRGGMGNGAFSGPNGGPGGRGGFRGPGGFGGPGGPGGPANVTPTTRPTTVPSTAPSNRPQGGPGAAPAGDRPPDGGPRDFGGPGGPRDFGGPGGGDRPEGPGGFGGRRFGRGGDFRGGPGGGFGGPSGGGPGGPGGPGGQSDLLSQPYIDLKTVLADAKADPKLVAEKVAAIRQARTDAQAELIAAQKDLLLLLTPEQETMLVSLGYLD